MRIMQCFDTPCGKRRRLNISLLNNLIVTIINSQDAGESCEASTPQDTSTSQTTVGGEGA